MRPLLTRVAFGVLKRLVERLEHHDALLEQRRVIGYRRAQPFDEVRDRRGVRRLVPIFLEIDVVHDLGDPFHRSVPDAEAILEYLEGAQIALVLETAGLIHVERHRVRIPVGRCRERERRVAIDEAPDEPRRCEPIDAGPRPRHPQRGCDTHPDRGERR